MAASPALFSRISSSLPPENPLDTLAGPTIVPAEAGEALEAQGCTLLRHGESVLFLCYRPLTLLGAAGTAHTLLELLGTRGARPLRAVCKQFCAAVAEHGWRGLPCTDAKGILCPGLGGLRKWLACHPRARVKRGDLRFHSYSVVHFFFSSPMTQKGEHLLLHELLEVWLGEMACAFCGGDGAEANEAAYAKAVAAITFTGQYIDRYFCPHYNRSTMAQLGSSCWAGARMGSLVRARGDAGAFARAAGDRVLRAWDDISVFLEASME